MKFIKLLFLNVLSVSIMFLMPFSATGQIVDWLVVTDTVSDFINVTKDNNGDYIQSRQAYQYGTIAYINNNGNVVWEGRPCLCNESTMLLSFKKSEDSIYTLTGNGALYKTGLDGDDSELLLQVYPDSSKFRLFGFLTNAILNGDKIIYHGNILTDSTNYDLTGSIDVNSLNVSNVLNVRNGVLRARHITDNDLDIRVYEIGDSSRLIISDFENNMLLDSTYDFAINGFTPRDITFFDNENIILVGSDGSYSSSNGVVISINENGALNWSKIYSPNEDLKIFLNGVYSSDDLDGILVVGAIGSFEDVGSYLMLIDSNGNVLLNHRRDIDNGYQTFGNKITKSDSGESIYAISGTTGVTDFGGPQRSVLYEIDIDRVSFEEDYLGDKLELVLYPNPTDEFLFIEASETISRVKIYDSNINLVHNVKEVHFNKLRINMIDFPSGVYYLEFHIGGESIVKQIIKK